MKSSFMISCKKTIFLSVIIIASLCDGRKSPRIDLERQECLKTSHYHRDEKQFVCKDLGRCYQYYCKASAKRCEECATPKQRSCTITNRKDSDAQNKEQSNEGRHTADTITTPKPQLLQVTTGNVSCSGFLAAIPLQSTFRLAIVTSARCLINFDVACQVEENDGKANSYRNVSKSKRACFNRNKAKVLSVRKGFRSYHTTVTYNGKNIDIALNGLSVFVPREFMECADCRYDIAVIRLPTKHMSFLDIDAERAYLLMSAKTPTLVNSDVIIDVRNKTERFSSRNISVDEADGYFRHRATVVSVEKMKVCLQFVSTHPDSGDNNAGSPIMLLEKMPMTEVSNKTQSLIPLRAFGVATHTISSSKGVNDVRAAGMANQRGNFSLESSILMSGARFTNDFMESIINWLEMGGDSCSEDENKLHQRFDCFPSINGEKDNSSLCLCAMGWKNERNICSDMDGISTEMCDWQPSNFAMNCNGAITKQERGTQSTRSTPELTIPGGTRQLRIVSMKLQNGPHLHEILRHLASLEVLVLDHNNIEVVSGKTLSSCTNLTILSIRYNDLNRIHSNGLRKSKLLEKVSFANNGITKINGNLFRNTKSLRILRLENNKISTLGQRCFHKNPKLEEMKLSYNKLKRLDDHLFEKNVKLIKVWLDNNMLKNIPATLFSNCKKLSYVNLEGNKLTSPPSSLFHSNYQLSSVNFNNNTIVKLPHDLFDNQPNLSNVTLHNNPSLPLSLSVPAFDTPLTLKSLHNLLDQYDREG